MNGNNGARCITAAVLVVLVTLLQTAEVLHQHNAFSLLSYVWSGCRANSIKMLGNLWGAVYCAGTGGLLVQKRDRRWMMMKAAASLTSFNQHSLSWYSADKSLVPKSTAQELSGHGMYACAITRYHCCLGKYRISQKGRGEENILWPLLAIPFLNGFCLVDCPYFQHDVI